MSDDGDLALLRLPKVLDRVGLGKTKVYELISKNEFPVPIKRFGVALWLNTDITDWIKRVSDDPIDRLSDEARSLL